VLLSQLVASVHLFTVTVRVMSVSYQSVFDTDQDAGDTRSLVMLRDEELELSTDQSLTLHIIVLASSVAYQVGLIDSRFTVHVWV